MVLGGVIEHVSGEDYFDYVRRHVYAPAGMKNTDAYEMDHDTPNLAIGYTRDPTGLGRPLLPGEVRNKWRLLDRRRPDRVRKRAPERQARGAGPGGHAHDLAGHS